MDIPRYVPDDVKNFPRKPGVYRFYNKDGLIIYVGKAKNLKSRVSSYFNDLSGHSRKTYKMVSEIKGIEFTIVNTEFDALLLENALIKENQPKYNILLKDDKSFPYITIVKEHFPRIYSTRQVDRKKGTYYGPYSGVRGMKSVLELIRNLYYVRTCNLNLSPEHIKTGKFKVCLEYHIGRCKGPCEGLQSEAEYLNDIQLAENILKGNLAPVRGYFKEQMQEAAGKMDFERAQLMKEKLESLENFQSRTVIVNPNLSEIDVFAITADEKRAYVNYIKIANGSIILSTTVEVKKKLEESDNELLAPLIFDLRQRYQSDSKEILTNIEVEYDPEVECRVPKIGDKKKLIDLAMKNALYYKKEKLSTAKPEDFYRERRVLEQLQQDLQLKSLPEHIECFDNSNLGGSNPVASMVYFSKGKPNKKEYRKYNIKTVTGSNDFASMEEIVHRRYKRLLDENTPLPNLIVVDGGKGQLSSAVQALQNLGIYGQVPIIGIAKRLEEIYFPQDEFPVHISKKSESLKLLQHLRNEAHRFAITFHRSKRSKSAIDSELARIEGIGPKTAEKLLSHFKSIKKIKAALPEEIEALVGKAKTQMVMKAFEK
ncbi:MAG: excinuclease ABC subunit C [Cyclobacteriaceae bacterium]|nr:excinuclease ABC subunit C [Cyclobacteriaceae bacterium]